MERICQEERKLCHLLALALTDKKAEKNSISEAESEKILDIASRHKVLPLLYDVLREQALTQSQKQMLDVRSRQIVQQSYHLLFFSKYITDQLEKAGIPSIILKGSVAAGRYPVPELRKSGDVDLFVSAEVPLEKIEQALEALQLKKQEEQHANHHVVYATAEGVEVEVHLSLMEDSQYARLNDSVKRFEKDIFAHRTQVETMGVTLPSLKDGYLAFSLLLHMIQHFTRSGFGLKLLCDWVVFWNGEVEEAEKQQFVRMAKESGTMGFTRMITEICIRYLGLGREKADFLFEGERISDEQAEAFLREIFESEEFGYANKERMVLLEGMGVQSFLKELHHQMKLTYPKASRIRVLWPALWIMLLVGFVYRNRKLRKVSTMAVLKNAAKRRQVVDGMKLFEK